MISNCVGRAVVDRFEVIISISGRLVDSERSRNEMIHDFGKDQSQDFQHPQFTIARDKFSSCRHEVVLLAKFDSHELTSRCRTKSALDMVPIDLCLKGIIEELHLHCVLSAQR